MILLLEVAKVTWINELPVAFDGWEVKKNNLLGVA